MNGHAGFGKYSIFRSIIYFLLKLETSKLDAKNKNKTF